MSVVNLTSQSGSIIPLEVLQLNNTLLNMISSNQEYFLSQNRLFYYAVSDEILLVLENTLLNKQIIDNYTIDFDATRLFSLKFISRNGGALELSLQNVINNLGSSLTITDLSEIHAIIYSKTNSYLRGAEIIGNDLEINEVIVYSGSNNKLKSSNKLITDLVDLSGTQTITGAKTLSGNVLLTALTTDTTTATNSVVMVKTDGTLVKNTSHNPTNIVDTTSAQTISGNKTFSGSVLATGLVNDTTTATNATVMVKSDGTLVKDTSLNPTNIVDTNSVQTITGNKTLSGTATFSNSAVVASALAIDTTTATNSVVMVKSDGTLVKATHLNPTNIVDTNTAQAITGVKSFNSDCMKVNNIFALGSALTLKNSSATSFDVIFNSKFTNPEPGWLSIKPSNTSAASTGIAFYGNLCVQENTEIMKILALSGLTDAAISSGQKLTVLNTTTNAVERINITPDNLATLSGTQTITGAKSFNSDCMRVNNIYSLGTRLTIKDSSTSYFDIFFNNKNGTSTNGWITIDPNGNPNPTSAGIAIWGDFRVEGLVEITSALTLSGTNTDTSISNGQKLAVLNTSTNNLQRVNITPDNLATLSGTQTISGDKTFTGTVNLGTVNASGRISASYTKIQLHHFKRLQL